MAAAETQTQTPPTEKKRFFSRRPKMDPDERYEARKHLVQLLLIVLMGVGIAYFGFHLGLGVLGFVLWLVGRFFGVA